MSSSKPEDDLRRPLAAAARYARGGVRSSQELLAYLRRRRVLPEVAQRVVLESQARGWLDDRACARLWADHWARKGYAWAAIRLKLSTKGLNEQAIEYAARRLRMALDDGARARLVVAQSLRRGGGHAPRPRLARTLASRGFDSDLIEQILNESLGPTAPDAEH